MEAEVTIEKMVHGGQGLAALGDGRKVFVWNALPGEIVRIRVIKSKRSYAEAIAESVVAFEGKQGEVSPQRAEPREANYLATSPWQMMTFEAENTYKREIVEELFAHEKVQLPGQNGRLANVIHDDRQWQYRSKMEYSFWGDDDGLHLALHQRGSHGKQIVAGSKLALPAVDEAARALTAKMNKLGVRAGDLKTVIVRCDQRGRAATSLFVKQEEFHKLFSGGLPPEIAGLRVYFSNPRSPASVPTRLLYEIGDCLLHDELLGQSFVYDVDSFWQVNLPVFEKALSVIRDNLRPTWSDAGLTDMYAGVGSIGLSVASGRVTLVDIDPASVRMAAQNAEAFAGTATVVEASTEKALEYITAGQPVIFDPPRAGLHDKVIARVLEVLPPQVTYLSCNPATHARDLARLQSAYQIIRFEIFNFFPRTPHIETLAILRRK
jgi:23S rRNA (uracil1939-C5)-methyltransferase